MSALTMYDKAAPGFTVRGRLSNELVSSSRESLHRDQDDPEFGVDAVRDPDIPHGVYSSYTNRRCRCSDCLAAANAYHRKRHRERKAADPTYNRRPSVASRKEYLELLASQDGRCAICSAEPTGGKNFCVDHDHETGALRGVLCRRCNSGLGHLGDSIDLLKSAIAYLEERS